MDDFEGRAIITIRPNTEDRPVGMTFTVCSSETANDGSIPYGDSIASAEVVATAPDGTDVSTSMVTTPAVVDTLTVKCGISYYTGIAAGLHTLTAILTMASGYVDEFELQRVMVETS